MTAPFIVAADDGTVVINGTAHAVGSGATNLVAELNDAIDVAMDARDPLSGADEDELAAALEILAPGTARTLADAPLIRKRTLLGLADLFLTLVATEPVQRLYSVFRRWRRHDGSFAYPALNLHDVEQWYARWQAHHQQPHTIDDDGTWQPGLPGRTGAYYVRFNDDDSGVCHAPLRAKLPVTWSRELPTVPDFYFFRRVGVPGSIDMAIRTDKGVWQWGDNFEITPERMAAAFPPDLFEWAPAVPGTRSEP